jgi:hypothetical protein
VQELVIEAATTMVLSGMIRPDVQRLTIERRTNGVHLDFAGILGHRYLLQFAGQVAGPWTNLTPVLPIGASGLIEVDDTVQACARFYRAMDTTPLPTGIVSWWRAESNACDFVGVNNGWLINGATFGTGFVGQAFSLNGDNQYVHVPGSASLAVTGPLTVDAWIKRSATGTQHSVVEKYGLTARGYAGGYAP